MKRSITATALVATLFAGSAIAAGPSFDPASKERGRYLVRIAGCNDCHTAHYPESGGKVPESEWLTGNGVGFQGPWGTTYPANLRLALNAMTEAQWLARARTEMRPPMPWFALRDMTDDDLRAIYRYVKAAGAKGEPAPAYVPPGQAVNTPFIVFAPQMPGKTVATATGK